MTLDPQSHLKLVTDEPVILKDTRPERTPRAARTPAEPPAPRIVIAGSPAGKAFTPETQIVGVDGKAIEPGAAFTWGEFLAWRRTKVAPYDYENGPKLAQDFGLTDHVRSRPLEEIDWGTHEFVGEVAELGALFTEFGPSVFYGALRDRLIDECGDIFFTGAWVLDAWGSNPLAGATDLEMLRVNEGDDLAVFAEVLATVPPEVALNNARFVGALGGFVFSLLVAAQTRAGLLCNSFKKLRWQRRPQDVEEQVARVAAVLFAANQLLVVANSSVEEALTVNRKKLDARYPDALNNGGLPGGGIRNPEGQTDANP